ncbi:anti-sigma factor [Reichenbachiella ulvae]|uniref:Regulator of SigK n=1 Tax=Reichenbachiella ulvae TaxID=2980104 RepID=A0ABT3CXY1_9BACT|nr:anti-sigma factor [Reichenbachiella ulvae]MCV9388419.1 anti-sigma factor [Reichenbachiella ulvae]
MKSKSNISQGDLELYALGMLSEEERMAIEQALSDPEIKAELDAIEEGLEAFAFANQMAPPADLKDKFMSQLEEEEEKPVIPLQPKVEKANSNRYWLAAAVSLAVISSALALLFFNKWQSTENQLAIAMQENSVLAENSQFTNQKLSAAENSLALMSNPEFEMIQLKGVEGSPELLSTVLWNPDTKETFLNIGNLKSLDENLQYQLWSIQDGQPVDAGVFDLDSSDYLIKMKNNEVPQAFAITIEPRGGSEVPTLDQMVVIGTIQS